MLVESTVMIGFDYRGKPLLRKGRNQLDGILTRGQLLLIKQLASAKIVKILEPYEPPVINNTPMVSDPTFIEHTPMVADHVDSFVHSTEVEGPFDVNPEPEPPVLDRSSTKMKTRKTKKKG